MLLPVTLDQDQAGSVPEYTCVVCTVYITLYGISPRKMEHTGTLTKLIGHFLVRDHDPVEGHDESGPEDRAGCLT